MSDSTDRTDLKDDQVEKMIKMMNKFLQIYNLKHSTNGSMFDNMDPKDSTATNDKMEEFYELMQEHNDLAKMNQDYIDVYGPKDKLPSTTEGNDNVYALIVGSERKIQYVSLSYMSLLSVGISERDDDINSGSTTDWGIIKLH